MVIMEEVVVGVGDGSSGVVEMEVDGGGVGPEAFHSSFDDD